MPGEEFLVAAGAAVVAGAVAARKNAAAEAWFDAGNRLPGPSLSKLGGAQVCIYQKGSPLPNDWPTFRDACIPLQNRYGFDIHWARNREDVQRILASYPRIARLILAGHGSPEYFFVGWCSGCSVSPRQLASYLRGRLAGNAVISLAGCSAGRNPDEPDTQYGPIGVGGAQSFAGVLRDALVASGAPSSAEIRAHTSRGHTTQNPRGRVFSFTQAGRGGNPVSVSQGLEAEQWMLNVQGALGDFTVPVSFPQVVTAALIVGGIASLLYFLPRTA